MVAKVTKTTSRQPVRGWFVVIVDDSYPEFNKQQQKLHYFSRFMHAGRILCTYRHIDLF